MLTAISAVLAHIIRLMTFNHDGRGLPTERGPSLYALMVLVVLSQVGRDAMDPAGVSLVITLSGAALYLGLMYVFVRPLVMAAALMGTIFGALTLMGFYAAGVVSENLETVVSGWELAALLVFIVRMIKRLSIEESTTRETRTGHGPKKPD